MLRGELPLINLFGGRLYADAHPLRTLGTLLAVARLVAVAALASAFPMGANSPGQPAGVMVLLVAHLFYLLMVRPYNSAGIGGMELTTSVVGVLACCGILAVMGGGGPNDFAR